MVTEDQNMEDTLAVMSSILQMMTADTKETCDQIREVRESIYAEYDPEDLKRMIRNVCRMFYSVWFAFHMQQKLDPVKAWEMFSLQAAAGLGGMGDPDSH